jgi:hypothetical protein
MHVNTDIMLLDIIHRPLFIWHTTFRRLDSVSTRLLSGQVTSRGKFSVRYQHKRTQFSYLFYTGQSCSFVTSCDAGSPNWGDVPAGSTDQMTYSRHEGESLTLTVRGVCFKPQHLRFFPSYFMAFFVRVLSWIWFSDQDTQLGGLSHLDSHHRRRSHKTTASSSAA